MGGFAGKWVAVLGAVMLAGCGIADSFGDRATAYNLEAEQVRSQGLLLNIVRAAYRKPMQFTDLTTVTGQITATAGAGTVLPLGGPPSGYQINPTTSLSGGPTFSVATQNNREFYLGILRPITMQHVGLYLEAGYPKKMLLALLAGTVTITDDLPGRGGLSKRTYFNQPRSPEQFERFEAILDEMIAAGLTVRPVPPELGPKMKASEVSGALEGVAAMLAQNLDLATSEDGKSYQFVRTQTDYVFCFDQQIEEQLKRQAAQRAPRQCQPSVKRFMKPSERLLNPRVIAAHRCDGKSNSPGNDTFSIGMHSTQGVIYYLGEIARQELKLESRDASGPEVVRTLGFDGCERTLFAVHRGSADPSLTVAYQGDTYSVATDASGNDRSTQVLDLLLQLFAVNSAAKDLPSSNVVTLVGH